MNLTPIEFYLTLAIVIPLGICFAKWKYSHRWIAAAAICAALSWIYFNLWMGLLDPPDNGFANFVYFVSGWFWLLPIFGVLFLIFRLMERCISEPIRLKIGTVGFSVCSIFALLVLVWNFSGRMSMDRAITEARYQLRQRGHEPVGRELPTYEDGHWIVRYPDSSFGEIRLTRNGKMSWIGGPG